LPLKGRIDYTESDPNGQNEVFVSDMILNILLMTIACFKMLAYMNVIPFVGKLNMFMRDCIYEMGQFMIYYGMFMFYFAMMWMLVGIELRPTDEADPASGDWVRTNGLFVYVMRLFSDPAGLPAYDNLDGAVNMDENDKKAVVWLIYFFWIL
jgi:hypothetical protein